ncbi:hypothetical protein BDV98DRAFT_597466 [Pterulicium gracile]|uniref:Uncharacterized protein n=1 Tax=Pterulicium gracile TaxID=1884261 RepID=A0A5C3Q862_9AGAR|nr:hypothetical protein BDV98DRAFT_597466 [Pterula gracilis]
MGKQRDSLRPAEPLAQCRGAVVDLEEAAFVKREPPMETIPELVKHTAEALGKNLLAIMGDSVRSSEMHTQRTAVQTLEADAEDVNQPNCWSPQEFVVATRCLTEHMDIALSYAAVKRMERRILYLKEQMGRRGCTLAR